MFFKLLSNTYLKLTQICALVKIEIGGKLVERKDDNMSLRGKTVSRKPHFSFSDRGSRKIKRRFSEKSIVQKFESKLYIPSTLNTDYLLWNTQLIVCAVKY